MDGVCAKPFEIVVCVKLSNHLVDNLRGPGHNRLGFGPVCSLTTNLML